MKLKIFNYLITILAVLGIFVIIGAVGKVDYMVSIGVDYPLWKICLTTCIGFIMLVPAIIREVI